MLFHHLSQDFLVGLFDLAQVSPEPVLVHLLARRLVPEPAPVRGYLVPEEHLSFVLAELKLEVNEYYTSNAEKFRKDSVDLERRFLHLCELRVGCPAEYPRVVFVYHGVAERVVLEEELEGRLLQYKPVFEAEPLAQTPCGYVPDDYLDRDNAEPFDQHLPV